MNEDNDVMLPEGWTEGSDFFALGDEGPAQQTADVQSQAAPAAAPTTEQPGADPAPTTEQDVKPDGAAPEQQAAPTTEQPAATEKLKFTAKVDRSDVDVELDPADLPSIYQRAQVTDRVQQRLQQLQPRVDKAEQLARTLGYADLDDMVSKAEGRFRETTVERLTARGVDKEVAEAVADSKLMAGRTGQTAPAAQSAQGAQEQSGGTRDFVVEMNVLRQAFPDAGKDGKLPEEVVNAAAREGKPLIAAYAAWDARQKAAEAERLRKEVEVLRQNQQNATKAPVTGTTGGGDTEQKPLDDFLLGFGE